MIDTGTTIGLAIAGMLVAMTVPAGPAAADHPNEAIQDADERCEQKADRADRDLPVYLGDDVCPIDEFGLNCQSHTCLPFVLDP